MGLTRIDVLNVTFDKSLRGYDVRQVDGFLQDVAEAMGELAEEHKEALTRLEILDKKLAEYAEREATLRDTLVTTQKMTEDMKATAQREAQLIIDAAHHKASAITSAAEHKTDGLREALAGLRRLKYQYEERILALAKEYARLVETGRAEDAELDKAEAQMDEQAAKVVDFQRPAKQSGEGA